jgi:geranylgeranyl diphosphate synthase type II
VLMPLSTKEDSTFDFESFVNKRRTAVEERLVEYLAHGEPKFLFDAMRYSVLGGGKRFRALLCLTAAEAVLNSGFSIMSGISAEDLVLPCCCAIEAIHAMSLIHDDLPCLDNDDFRRGKPTNHKVFGEAMALLAGDALLVFANEILIDMTPPKVPAEIVLEVVRELARATGASGMVGGQVADLCAGGIETTSSSIQFIGNYSDQIESHTLENIHKGKTGALILFSLWSGARLAGASDLQLRSLSRFGEILGLAFQIRDDFLDVTGDLNTLGKTPGKDEALRKLTWIRLFGQDGARQKLIDLESDGMEALDKSSLAHDCLPALQALLGYAIHREH